MFQTHGGSSHSACGSGAPQSPGSNRLNVSGSPSPSQGRQPSWQPTPLQAQATHLQACTQSCLSSYILWYGHTPFHAPLPSSFSSWCLRTVLFEAVSSKDDSPQRVPSARLLAPRRVQDPCLCLYGFLCQDGASLPPVEDMTSLPPRVPVTGSEAAIWGLPAMVCGLYGTKSFFSVVFPWSQLYVSVSK